MQRVLVTGGAGFIGSYVADVLLDAGYTVRVLDSLCRQVHPRGTVPAYLSREVEFLCGDVRDPYMVEKALDDVNAVIHLAAAVGVGQSMYQIGHYTSVNDQGTAVLLESLLKMPVERLIVASSMSIYGEGLYRDRHGTIVETAERSRQQLARGEWELRDDEGHLMNPIPTHERKRPTLASVYALSKYDQERLCLLTGEAYSIPTVALRFFNVYGPRQSLSNPYTGVLAIFASQLLSGKRPLVYEDGEQRRDFVHVTDVAKSCRLALEKDGAEFEVFNIGSGRAFTIREVAERLAHVLDRPTEPQITGNFRAGDIRHCYADIGKASAVLGYAPSAKFEPALEELAEWLSGQMVEDHVEEATRELIVRGLAM